MGRRVPRWPGLVCDRFGLFALGPMLSAFDWSDTPVLPRARLGPKPSEFAGSLVSDEKWTCAPGSHWVMRCCRPLARLFALRTMMKMVPTAGFAPAPPRSQRGMLTVTICRVFEMGPSVGFAPTCACLQDRCLSQSATKTWNGALTRTCTSSFHLRKVVCMALTL